jgi:hypothetical protein
MTTAGASLRFLVRLECGHDVELTVAIPGISTLQFCYGCDTWKRVTGYPEYYRARCMSERRACMDRLSSSEKRIRKTMESHGRSYPSHALELRWYSGDNKMIVVATYSPSKGGWDSNPESIADISKRAQSLLRTRAVQDE